VPERQLRPVLTRHAVATGMARPGSCATILSRAGRRSSSVAQAVGRPDAVDDVELPQPHRHLALPPPVILPTTAAGHGVDQAVPHQHPMIMIRDGIRPGQPLRPSSNSMRRAPHRGMVAAQLAVPRIRPGRYVGARPIRATFRSIRPGRGRPDPRTRLAMTQPAAPPPWPRLGPWPVIPARFTPPDPRTFRLGRAARSGGQTERVPGPDARPRERAGRLQLRR
jgi:hypothetical protein